MASVKTGKSLPKSVPNPPSGRAQFALGTRPPSLRAEPMKRIKPQTGVTDYSKRSGDNPPNVAGAGFGDTLGPSGT
jgi:hypothetical protein